MVNSYVPPRRGDRFTRHVYDFNLLTEGKVDVREYFFVLTKREQEILTAIKYAGVGSDTINETARNLSRTPEAINKAAATAMFKITRRIRFERKLAVAKKLMGSRV